MAITPVSCFVVTCDVCKEHAENDECVPHFMSAEDVRATFKICFPEWTLCADGTAICDDGDAEHRDAIDALMPPEFDPVCNGQTGIPFTENGATTP